MIKRLIQSPFKAFDWAIYVVGEAIAWPLLIIRRLWERGGWERVAIIGMVVFLALLLFILDAVFSDDSPSCEELGYYECNEERPSPF